MLDFTRLMLISTQVEVVDGVGVELGKTKDKKDRRKKYTNSTLYRMNNKCFIVRDSDATRTSKVVIQVVIDLDIACHPRPLQKVNEVILEQEKSF